jgi:predicted kinase
VKRAIFECHLVCGPPAAGKTEFARELANRLGAFLLDSDQVTERLVRAGLKLAGMDPDDRDSAAYKAAYREPVYATLFDLAREHLQRGPVVIAGPFTSETRDPNGLQTIESEVLQAVTGHFVWCHPDERRRRIQDRGAQRDIPKIRAWEAYVASCREEAPSWPHSFIDTSAAK